MEIGSSSFSFENPGDEVEGILLSTDRKQQTDINTGELKFWDSGDPIWVEIWTLQTDLRDDATDDGQRAVWIYGHRFTATRDALKRAGVKREEVGAWYKLRFAEYSDRAPAIKGGSKAKLFQAWYKRPDQVGGNGNKAPAGAYDEAPPF